MTCDPIHIASTFNEYFVIKGPILGEKNQCNFCESDYLGTDNPNSQFFILVTANKIVEVASHCLNLNKAAGIDNLKPSFIRRITHLLADPCL